MMQIAVVDDDYEERARICACLKYITEKDGVDFSVSEFNDGVSFLGTYAPTYDIVLMDIEMPGMDGIETARQLRQIDNTVVLIFITHMTQCAVKGYEVDALDFIVKPIDKYGFALKMSRAITRSASSSDNNLLLRVDGEIISIRRNSVKYIETDGHYAVYHTFDGVYREYTTLKNVEKKIGGNFARCNSCYLVNLKCVSGVRKNTVVVDKEELPISRPKKRVFLSALTSFMGGG